MLIVLVKPLASQNFLIASVHPNRRLRSDPPISVGVIVPPAVLLLSPGVGLLLLLLLLLTNAILVNTALFLLLPGILQLYLPVSFVYSLLLLVSSIDAPLIVLLLPYLSRFASIVVSSPLFILLLRPYLSLLHLLLSLYLTLLLLLLSLSLYLSLLFLLSRRTIVLRLPLWLLLRLCLLLISLLV